MTQCEHRTFLPHRNWLAQEGVDIIGAGDAHCRRRDRSAGIRRHQPGIDANPVADLGDRSDRQRLDAADLPQGLGRFRIEQTAGADLDFVDDGLELIALDDRER